jgi:3-isopropylmalate/(R)-2-methylmalate dehydratase large subunit
MATGKCWFKVPGAVKVVLSGKKRKYVSGKDIILYLIGLIGVDGARYESLEFFGSISELSMDERFTIANMAIEAGAKNAVFAVDQITKEYIESHGGNYGQSFEADDDAVYRRTIEIDLGAIPLTVAFPHLPENAKSIEETEKLHIKVDQVVIGSCTNGRIEDMRVAAGILKGKKISEDVRCIVIPATQAIYKQCSAEGLLDDFVDAGAVFSAPTCGPCLGGYMGVLAEGERCVSTTNRNFVGRMGHVKSEVYLASPVVAAYSALKGYICGPEAHSHE